MERLLSLVGVARSVVYNMAVGSLQGRIDAVYCHTCCKTLKTKNITVTRGNWELNSINFPLALFSRAGLRKAMGELPELGKLQNISVLCGVGVSVAVPLQI